MNRVIMFCFLAGGRLHTDHDIGDSLTPFFIFTKGSIEGNSNRAIHIDFLGRRIAVTPKSSLIVKGCNIGTKCRFMHIPT